MEFYRIALNAIPYPVFAHIHKTQEKSWITGSLPDIMEICYIDKTAIICEKNGTSLTVPEGWVYCMPHGTKMTIHNTGAQHIHYTAAFVCDKADVTDAAEYDGAVYLPRLIPPQRVSKLPDMIMRLALTLPEDTLLRGSLMMELLQEITAFSRMESHCEHLLTHKVKKYICAHTEEQITPLGLADLLGVSYGHLSRVFTGDTSMTLTEYINRVKLRRVRELLTLSDMTLESAGHSVGIDDVKYLSRLFHKTFGITAREFIGSVRKK